MAEKIKADASPEKRLFISLITRDIPLIAAFLDLIDNSINAAVEPYSARLKTAQDYADVLADQTISPKVTISLTISKDKVVISDDASGISSKVAKEHVFKFGRSDKETHESDRLSVYGIGLKRGIFKLGNKIDIVSDHADGGFVLDLNVRKWEKDRSQPWTFLISERQKAQTTGTSISVAELYDDVARRLDDGVFVGQLKEAIARTYAYYLAKFVTIVVNKDPVEGVSIDIGNNIQSDQLVDGKVTCAITAGIGIPVGGKFRDRSSGWFVFCNGRTVLSADKSPLTGWGGQGFPIFQPKHRPFLGTVFFVSSDPETLPWTTTKSAINEDSAVWQAARRHMASVGRVVISFLDGRYTDEGTEVASADLQEAAGARTSVISAAVAQKQTFAPPKKPKPENVRVQYDAKVSDVKRIEDYLKRPGMGAAEVGRHTFHHFLRNQVGD